MTVPTCDNCRAIFDFLRVAGVSGAARPAAKLPAILESAPLKHTEKRVEAPQVQALVNLRKVYERDLADKPESPEAELKRGIVTGIQLSIDSLAHALEIEVDDPAPKRIRAPRASNGAREPTTKTTPLDGISPYAASLLRAAASRHPKPSSDRQISVLSGRSIKSSDFGGAISELRDAGLIEGPKDARSLTDAGVAKAGHVEKMPTGAALVDRWCAKLPQYEATMLRACVSLARSSHGPVDKDRLSEETGYSITSSDFGTSLGRLCKLGLIDKSRRPIEELLR